MKCYTWPKNWDASVSKQGKVEAGSVNMVMDFRIL